jgi:hypothetical protein
MSLAVVIARLSTVCRGRWAGTATSSFPAPMLSGAFSYAVRGRIPAATVMGARREL